jgi:hypothetical protein
MNAKLQKIYDRAKALPSALHGAIPVSHLSLAERRELAAAGLSFRVNRMGEPHVAYPQSKRDDDFRAAVAARRAARLST